MTPMATASVAVHGVLSPKGSCKTFDASADGYARGEAINAIYIKRFDDALRDNSPIRAVIRGTGSNCDGRGEGPLTPNGKAHEALIRRTYATSGLDPQKTAYVEVSKLLIEAVVKFLTIYKCHGTGTPTGDPIETTAIGNVFGDRGVIIGSVSSSRNPIEFKFYTDCSLGKAKCRTFRGCIGYHELNQSDSCTGAPCDPAQHQVQNTQSQK